MKIPTYWIGSCIALAIVLLASPAAHAASFECARAATPTEKAICHDPAVSSLDDQVAIAFKLAIDYWPAGNWKDFLRKEQREWLKTRNAECKADVTCLKRDYELRLTFLKQPDLKYMGRYVSGTCNAGGVFLDVTPSYPKDGIDVELYLCPNAEGNMLFQASGKVDVSGKLAFDDAGCRRVLQFTQDMVTLTNPATESCMLMIDSRTFRRDPTKSPYELE